MTTKSRFDKYETYFHDIAVRFDQASKDGKLIVSVSSMSNICQAIAELVKEIKKGE